MALRTKGNQVVDVIISGLCTRALMMHLEIGAFAAELALPTIAREHLHAELLVSRRFKPLSAHG
jgi:hypothetical protein